MPFSRMSVIRCVNPKRVYLHLMFLIALSFCCALIFKGATSGIRTLLTRNAPHKANVPHSKPREQLLPGNYLPVSYQAQSKRGQAEVGRHSPFVKTYPTNSSVNNAKRKSKFKFSLDAVRDSEEDFESDYSGYISADEIPVFHQKPVSCQLLFEGDPLESDRAVKYQEQTSAKSRPLSYWQEISSECAAFREERGYLTKPVSQEEETFPLAFSLVVFKDVDQVERLLRAVYRPQNLYCIHVDKKAPIEVMESIASLANCFHNVFLTSKSVEVHWGFFSVLEPDLICMDELVKYRKWRYFINLTGQEFPLKTNLDMVKILKTFQGANDITGSPYNKLSPIFRDRIQFIHVEGAGKTDSMKEPFGHNITMAKGSVHILASRAFVEYVTLDPLALEFREWCRDTGHASEHFFNSLEYSPQLGVPGAYEGLSLEKKSVTRWKKWEWDDNYKCRGKYVHNICILGVRDLPSLRDTQYLFVNKLHARYHPLAYDCLEELHFNRTRDEILGHRSFDAYAYSRMELVQDRLRVLVNKEGRG